MPKDTERFIDEMETKTFIKKQEIQKLKKKKFFIQTNTGGLSQVNIFY